MADSLQASSLRSSYGRDLMYAILAGLAAAIFDILHISAFERLSRDRARPRGRFSVHLDLPPPLLLSQPVWLVVEISLCALAGFWIEWHSGGLRKLAAWLASLDGLGWDFEAVVPDGAFHEAFGNGTRHIGAAGEGGAGPAREEEEMERGYHEAMTLKEFSRCSLQIARWLKDWPDGDTEFPAHTTGAKFVIVPSVPETELDGRGIQTSPTMITCHSSAVDCVGHIGGDNRDHNHRRTSQGHGKRRGRVEAAPISDRDSHYYSDQDSDETWVSELEESGTQADLLRWMRFRRRQKAQHQRGLQRRTLR